MTSQMQTKSAVAAPARRSPSRIALYTAAGMSAVIAVVYLLIGLQVLEVIDPTDDQPAFGFSAAGFFLVLAVVLLTVRRPVVWLVAGLIQLFVIFTYFNLAGERDPSYEVWGITLRVLQVPMIVGLVHLLIRGRERQET